MLSAWLGIGPLLYICGALLASLKSMRAACLLH